MKTRIIQILVVTILLIMATTFAFANTSDTNRGVMTTITTTIGSDQMTVNGQTITIDSPAVIIDGRTLVPLRAISEAFGAEVSWETNLTVDRIYPFAVNHDPVQPNINVASIKYEYLEILFVQTVGEYFAPSAILVHNDDILWLDVSPTIINGRVMVPLRAISATFGADTTWNADTRTVTITHIPYVRNFVTVGDVTITIRDTLADVEEQLGRADRIDMSVYDFDWHVFNSDLTRLIIVGVRDDVVVAVYTNARRFESSIGNYGEVNNTIHLPIRTRNSVPENTVITDLNNRNLVYAVFIRCNSVRLNSHVDTQALARGFEKQFFDVQNAFRVNNGRRALIWSDGASVAARLHSEDMNSGGFLSHVGSDGSRVPDRLRKQDVRFRSSSENAQTIGGGDIASINAFFALNRFANSERGHRENLINERFTHTGIGIVVNFGMGASLNTVKFFGQ